MKPIEGQITIEEYLTQRPKLVLGGCTVCICKNCLYWWSSRCPHGKCWDDYRAIINPYDRAHPDEPPRKWWSDWDKPGEQARWCRGGVNYPIYYCADFIKYKGQQVKTCLKSNVSVFQDGYIGCDIIKSVGCEKCYEEFCEKED